MDFDEFKEEFLTCLYSLRPEDCEVTVIPCRKNNGLVLTGVTLRATGNILAPTLYLENYYEEYKRGGCIAELVKGMLSVFEETKHCRPVGIEDLSDYSKMKKRVLCRVINTERNLELLDEVPFVCFMDLSVVFYCTVSVDDYDTGTVMIRNDTYANWGITVDELYKDALDNTKRAFNYDIMGIEEMVLMLARKRGDEAEIEQLEEAFANIREQEPTPGMYVAFSDKGVFGSSLLLETETLAQFAQKLERDFYIIPSSVHELIFVPVSENISADDLKDMVKTVNDTEVAVQEVLSDSIYLFDSKREKIVPV